MLTGADIQVARSGAASARSLIECKALLFFDLHSSPATLPATSGRLAARQQFILNEIQRWLSHYNGEFRLWWRGRLVGSRPFFASRCFPWLSFSISPNCGLPVGGGRWRRLQFMKMLFFSSDRAEVRQVSKEFTQAGIPCEIRNEVLVRGNFREAELWIRNDGDCHRAFMLCVQLGIGFARRPVVAAEKEG
jgi:hypothetical protein